MGLLTPCIVPRGGFLYRMIVPGGGFLLRSSRVPGGMVMDEIDTCIIFATYNNKTPAGPYSLLLLSSGRKV